MKEFKLNFVAPGVESLRKEKFPIRAKSYRHAAILGEALVQKIAPGAQPRGVVIYHDAPRGPRMQGWRYGGSAPQPLAKPRWNYSDQFPMKMLTHSREVDIATITTHHRGEDGVVIIQATYEQAYRRKEKRTKLSLGSIVHDRVTADESQHREYFGAILQSDLPEESDSFSTGWFARFENREFDNTVFIEEYKDLADRNFIEFIHNELVGAWSLHTPPFTLDQETIKNTTHRWFRLHFRFENPSDALRFKFEYQG